MFRRHKFANPHPIARPFQQELAQRIRRHLRMALRKYAIPQHVPQRPAACARSTCGRASL